MKVKHVRVEGKIPSLTATALSAHANTPANIGSPLDAVTSAPNAAAPHTEANATDSCTCGGGDATATSEFKFTTAPAVIHPKCRLMGK